MTVRHFLFYRQGGRRLATVAEKKLLKRNKILEAAYELFASKGIHMTAIDEVVKKAGVAKGTFYLYFRDKYDLTDQIILHKSTQIVRQVLAEVREQGAKEHLDGVEQILLFLDKIISTMMQNRPTLTLLSGKISTVYDLLMADEDSEFQENARSLTEMLMKIGFSAEQAQKHLYVMLNMFCSVCCNAILSGAPYTVEELRPEIQIMARKLLT